MALPHRGQLYVLVAVLACAFQVGATGLRSGQQLLPSKLAPVANAATQLSRLKSSPEKEVRESAAGTLSLAAVLRLKQFWDDNKSTLSKNGKGQVVQIPTKKLLQSPSSPVSELLQETSDGDVAEGGETLKWNGFETNESAAAAPTGSLADAIYDGQAAANSQAGFIRFTPNFVAGIHQLQGDEVEEFIERDKCLVLFYACWNYASSTSVKHFNGFAAATASAGVRFGVVNTEVNSNSKVAEKLGIQSIPSIVYFPMGVRSFSRFDAIPTEGSLATWVSSLDNAPEHSAYGKRLRALEEEEGNSRSIPATTATSINFLSAINEYRLEHHTPKVRWDGHLAFEVQKRLTSLAKGTCVAEYDHSSPFSNFGQVYVDADQAQRSSFAQAAVKSLYQASGGYNYVTGGGCTGSCVGFEQLLWLSSTLVGCGSAVCDKRSSGQGTMGETTEHRLFGCYFYPPRSGDLATQNVFSMNINDTLKPPVVDRQARALKTAEDARKITDLLNISQKPSSKEPEVSNTAPASVSTSGVSIVAG